MNTSDGLDKLGDEWFAPMEGQTEETTDENEGADVPEGSTDVDKDKDDAPVVPVTTESGKETKEEETPKTDDGLAFVNALKEKFGIDGEYEPTEEGILQLIDDAKAKETAESPLVVEFKEHVAKGGSPESFKLVQQLNNWSELVVPKDGDDAETIQSEWVEDGLKARGVSDKMVKATIEALKAAGGEDLYEAAVEQRDYLESLEKTHTDAIVKSEQEAKTLADKEALDKRTAALTIFGKETIDGLTFTKQEREEMRIDTYGTKQEREKLNKEREKANVKLTSWDELSEEKKQVIEYLIKNNVDLSKLAGRSIKAQTKDNQAPKGGRPITSILNKTNAKQEEMSTDDMRELLGQVRK